MDQLTTDEEANRLSYKRVSVWLDWGSQYLGAGVLRLQLILIVLAIVIWMFLKIVGATAWLPGNLFFTICIGNLASALVYNARFLYANKPAPWNWLIYVGVIIAVGITASAIAEAAFLFVFRRTFSDFAKRVIADAPIGTLVTLVFSVVSYRFDQQREKFEAGQRELQGQVQLGQLKEQTHEAELAQAHEIQRHLLPLETPQIPGFQIACAWQPAKSVSGDYFDVLDLGAGRLGLCIADVSGKGITAALLMANLQASVKAFAPEAASPAALCARLNGVLCDTVAPGKFVTLFYGVVDTQQRQLHYENAGHCLPLVVRGDGSVLLPASYSGVLGLFSHWTYQDSQLELESGDCLVLITDGVLEAANAEEEEFGYQRLIDAVEQARQTGAHGIRSAILTAVSVFCNGKFDDDASLIVVTVE
ncbi:Serine phosphatase RsbU, regulator of sigma subunit [Acidisarcina polymorpha]|uniref:Serine phosphatase RsbU, regulator of sigma subunit n=1 Tax=Acidisarcina polymorpha TaxID=2211140 RepID=A0A2Z5G4U3_9BACT|nr:PP2C family protein-serine/threonine phosphatase [Acidisarcina polymorpha]AXC14213.1 Serine phosphatase RsbU, regulator of sigma subunit [Acidisarcina polymorpha]